MPSVPILSVVMLSEYCCTVLLSAMFLTVVVLTDVKFYTFAGFIYG